MNLNMYPYHNFGLHFVLPTNASQPWEIYTCWRCDDFMRLLLAAWPTLLALQQILAYADIFICTRPAAQPLLGIALPNEPQDQMYTTLFILGPQTPKAFIVETTSTTAEPSGSVCTVLWPCSCPPLSLPFLISSLTSPTSASSHLWKAFPMGFDSTQAEFTL
jgi:hypothetical protein